MKIAVQVTLLSGTSPGGKAHGAKDHGFDGVELVCWGGGGVARMPDEAHAILPILPISSICGNLNLLGRGAGDIDFKAAFAALRGAGFHGFMSFECTISGATEADKTANLATSIRFVRDAMSA
jgi:sugar phosphate isomerase/epimerase